jgi:sulfatase maturation enzyme AslB (radical SAM superfamily)
MEFTKRFHIYAEFGFPVCRTLRDDREYHRLDLTQAEFRSAVEKLLAYKRKGYPILFSAQIMEKILQWPDYDKKTIIADTPPSFEHVRCFGGRHMVFIDCDGKVYPCIQFIGNFDALDFRVAGIKKAVEHSAQHSCKACYLMCVNDLNLMFSLHPSVLYNNFRITLDETFRPHRFDTLDFIHFTGLQK